MERIFDFPRRVRFVAANVAASDTVKGSHIQRNPLSMGALAEQEEWPRVSQSPKEKKRRDCVMTARLTLSGMQQRKLAHSCEVASYAVLLTLRPTDAEAPSGHTQAGLRPGNVQELHGTAYPTPVLATNDGFSRAG